MKLLVSNIICYKTYHFTRRAIYYHYHHYYYYYYIYIYIYIRTHTHTHIYIYIYIVSIRYFLNLLLDCTVGLFSMYYLLRASSFVVERFNLILFRSGDYGYPPAVKVSLHLLIFFTSCSLSFLFFDIYWVLSLSFLPFLSIYFFLPAH